MKKQDAASQTRIKIEYDITFLRPGGGQWTIGDLVIGKTTTFERGKDKP